MAAVQLIQREPLPATTLAPALARDVVGTALVGAKFDSANAFDAKLVASELVTNALQAGASSIVLSVFAGPAGLEIAVSDDVDGAPRQQPPDASATRGRGLAIVASLASDWGVRANADGVGKSVWAIFALP